MAEDGRRCGSLVTKVEMRQAEGTWGLKHLRWVRAFWPQCCAAEGKAPTVGQDTVATAAMLQREKETAHQHRQDASLSQGHRDNVQGLALWFSCPEFHSPRTPAGLLEPQRIISGSWEWGGG